MLWCVVLCCVVLCCVVLCCVVLCCVVLCCVVLKGKLTTCERSLHLSILDKNSFWGLEGLCDRWVRELCIFVCHTNHSMGCIKERIKLPVRKLMASTLNWRHVSLLYVVQSNILWLTILLSYHYRCNVVFTNYIFPVSFLLYITTQKNSTKSLLWTVLRILLSPKKITLARFACLCFDVGDSPVRILWLGSPKATQ